MADETMAEAEQIQRPITLFDQITIDEYAAMYTGRTKISRLCFIADKFAGKQTELDALKIAYDEVKKGENVQMFREVVAKIGGRLGEEYSSDSEWEDAADRGAKEEEERLNSALKEYKSVKQSRKWTTSVLSDRIQEIYAGMGDLKYKQGQLDEAHGNYIYKQPGHCYTQTNIVKMCLNAILVSIEMDMFSRVLTYVGQAEKCADVLNPDMTVKLRCAAGLAYLKNKEYKLAALKFLETSPYIEKPYPEVIAPRDIAIYGGLCALASFDRAELKREVINNMKFQQFLKLAPKIREIINSFYARKFASYVEFLDELKATLLLDFHVHNYVEDLYAQIRNNALISYTTPYLRIHLTVMADAFKTSVPELVEELILLIEKNQLKARYYPDRVLLAMDASVIRVVPFTPSVEGITESYIKMTMVIHFWLSKSDILAAV